MFTYFIFPAFYQLENLTSHESRRAASEPSQLKTKPRRGAVQPPKTAACRQRPLPPPPLPCPASSSSNLRRPCDPPPSPASSPLGLRGRSKRRRPPVASLPRPCAPRAPPTQVRSLCSVRSCPNRAGLVGLPLIALPRSVVSSGYLPESEFYKIEAILRFVRFPEFSDCDDRIWLVLAEACGICAGRGGCRTCPR